MFPVYSILIDDPAVYDLLFDSSMSPPRLRAWGFGYASENDVGSGPAVKPYVTWQEPVDEPDNLLTCDPTHNSVTYQFDVYAREGGAANTINSALQYALRRHGYINAIRRSLFDPDTKLYHAGFDLLYIQMR